MLSMNINNTWCAGFDGRFTIEQGAYVFTEGKQDRFSTRFKKVLQLQS